jgi:hypothetical protein
MRFLKNNIITLFILFCIGCTPIKPFPDQKYSFKNDFFLPAYQSHLINIRGHAFDSEQVSNKHLDPLIIDAMNNANAIIKNPEIHYPEIASQISDMNIKKITIASASRSPMLQFRLSAKYKAKYLSSFHLLGLAVDLEMRGKSFDFRDDPKQLKHYHTLEKVLNKAGMVFSEPKEKDPNHVELYRFCLKKNPNADLIELKKKERTLILRLITIVEERLEKQKRSRLKLHDHRLLKDLRRALPDPI